MDILSIFVSLEFIMWVNNIEFLSLFELYARNSIFLILIIFQTVFNTYQPLSSDLRIGYITRYIIACITFFFFMSALLFLTQFRYIGGVWGRGIIFQNLILVFVLGLVFRWLIKLYKKRVIGAVEVSALLILGKDKLQTFVRENFRSLKNVNVYIYLEGNEKIRISDQNLSKVIFIRGKKNLESYFQKENQIFDFVIFDSNVSISDDTLRDLMDAKLHGLKVFDLTDFFEYYFEKISVLNVQDRWIVFSNGFSIISNKIALRLKAILDFVGALLLLILTSPLIILAAFLVKITSTGPILYSQVRVGLSGKEFNIFKLRTMIADAEKEGAKWSSFNDPRITKIGAIFRKTRIDELPQLFNILRGDMSFIGPRPERPEFIKILVEEIPYYSLRHLMKPGLSGWAQVNYDYGSSVNDSLVKLEYDLYYIKNYSFYLDLRTIIKTIRVVVFGKGR
ncbi:exopolysaccharide biosynthesis polyprenyl glycosylphosphotransferase [Leptospira wolbachii]|nr:exopolysaccharide biosynthesis polyprenyl glycosylphosphotransferase [Leptospira wolbachii]